MPPAALTRARRCGFSLLLAAAATAQAPPSAPPLTINISQPLVPSSSSPLSSTVPSELFGLDLEFTRHDIFNGLSAQLVSNRAFAVQPPGTRWPVSWPAGFPPHWLAVGDVVITAQERGVSCTLTSSNPLCGVQQDPFGGGFASGVSFGASIGVQQGKAYWLRVQAGADGGSPLALTVSLPGVAATTLQVPPSPSPTDVAALDFNFTSPVTSSNVSLLLAASGSSGTLRLASVSLLPTDPGATFGAPGGALLRADVVAALKGLGFTGPLRYPGGCFAPFYPWKAQLLSPDYFTRPTIFTPPDYCTAVAGGVNAYTDGFEQDGPSLDEYLALCAELGAEPAVTFALQFGTAAEVQDAADLVEYLNGDAEATVWGKVRAGRGHPEPYNVSLFYLGNEINMQARYPNYPADPSNVTGPPGAAEYAAILSTLVPAVLAVDPSVRLLAVEGGQAWDAAWQAAPGVGGNVYATSFHGGYSTASGPGGLPNPTPHDYTAAAKVPTGPFLANLQALRSVLDAANATDVSISCDEWGLGPPWDVTAFNCAHGLFGASLFTALLASFQATRTAFSNYFEPVNEGALQVGQFDVSVTPLGAVFPLYAGYAGGLMVSVSGGSGPGDDVVCAAATFGPAAAPTSVLATLVNRNASSAFSQALTFVGCGGPCGGGAGAGAASVTTLTATGLFEPNSTFVETVAQAPVDGQGTVVVAVPAYSVVQVAVQL